MTAPNPATRRAHYHNNPQPYKDRARARTKELRLLVEKAKDVACLDCGVKYPSFVMDFDHVRGEKVMNISAMVTRGFSVKKLLEEIDKCDVVCANCHRLRTFAPPSPNGWAPPL